MEPYALYRYILRYCTYIQCRCNNPAPLNLGDNKCTSPPAVTMGSPDLPICIQWFDLKPWQSGKKCKLRASALDVQCVPQINSLQSIVMTLSMFIGVQNRAAESTNLRLRLQLRSGNIEPTPAPTPLWLRPNINIPYYSPFFVSSTLTQRHPSDWARALPDFT